MMRFSLLSLVVEQIDIIVREWWGEVVCYQSLALLGNGGLLVDGQATFHVLLMA